MNVKQLIRTVNFTLKQNDLFPEHSRILVACSGGPDSMALFHLLLDVAAHRHIHWHIGVAIMDHQIRRESKDEVLWLQDRVKALNLDFYNVAIDVPAFSMERKISVETAGRDIRYGWLTDLARAKRYDYIAVAHHKNDQAESILAHLIRGSGMNGLQGMSVLSHSYAIPVVRPLLEVKKEALLAYLEERHISYCVDCTNDDIEYQRNRIRHCIIPELEKINPAVIDSLERMSRSVTEDMEFLQQMAQEVFDTLISVDDRSCTVSRRRLRQQPMALQRRLWQMMVRVVDNRLILSFAHQAQLSDIVQTGEVKTFTIARIIIEARCDTIKVYSKH
ncbi:tRNA lysidine(34) synthetase TilS [Veillonella denticariosi JCM 15641]|uniref:tRNA(Ile)-lysidine synthase n=1 Tax=Veillonella denticariosi JCM 15641 TaxID=1298594 RepID=A0A2S7Z8I7_9FIRM|nr:tRNA lysidine(34) synthetase TilS [Veillonella denticariosi]PQL19578.1 tRNA lysidine(34) synthetase TilS [Veillonella denticariosi JCM 15641]